VLFLAAGGSRLPAIDRIMLYAAVALPLLRYQ
jgi:hypothetical protein